MYTEHDKQLACRQLTAIDQTIGHLERHCEELNRIHLPDSLKLSADEFRKRFEFVREAFGEMFYEPREAAEEVIEAVEGHSEHKHEAIESRRIMEGL